MCNKHLTLNLDKIENTFTIRLSNKLFSLFVYLFKTKTVIHPTRHNFGCYPLVAKPDIGRNSCPSNKGKREKYKTNLTFLPLNPQNKKTNNTPAYRRH